MQILIHHQSNVIMMSTLNRIIMMLKGTLCQFKMKIGLNLDLSLLLQSRFKPKINEKLK